MRYPLIVIPGEPFDGSKLIPPMSQEVPCPSCLKPMLLTLKKLSKIFLHYFIDDHNEDLDVMCLICIRNDEIENEDLPRFRRKMKILSVD